LTSPCQPVKGVHNGCWMASPQDVERTTVDRFYPYVTDIVREFKSDERVAWWEVFNEPDSLREFSIQLRVAAYGWIKDIAPLAPVMSCWDENEATDLNDHHQYSVPWFGASNDVFRNETERMTGGLVTEAGARWYQGYPADAGNPLTVIDWLTKLRANPAAPFVPGTTCNALHFDPAMYSCLSSSTICENQCYGKFSFLHLLFHYIPDCTQVL
jgi:hypothetical protein